MQKKHMQKTMQKHMQKKSFNIPQGLSQAKILLNLALAWKGAQGTVSKLPS